jgi:hypothetical protein
MARHKAKDSKPAVAAVAVDEDLVKPTQYRHANITVLPQVYEALKIHPAFKPLKLEPINKPGANIPKNVDSKDPESIFRGLWDNDIIDQMVYYTNACAERTKARLIAAVKKAIEKRAAVKATEDSDVNDVDDFAVIQRPWIPVTVHDILAYIGIVL